MFMLEKLSLADSLAAFATAHMGRSDMRMLEPRRASKGSEREI